MIRTATAALLTLTLMGITAQAPSAPSPERGPGQPAADGGLLATHEIDPIQGSFWAPAGSPARRPETQLTQRSWSPSPQLAQR